MNAVATPVGENTAMRLRIAALVNAVEAANRRVCDLSVSTENAFDGVTMPLELAALAGSGIPADAVQQMRAAMQAHGKARAIEIEAEGELHHAMAVLLHALRAGRANA